MAATKLNRCWTLAAILLAAIIVIGGIVVWLRFSPSQPVEISVPPGQQQQGRIYIGGTVANPGFYPFTGRDSIEALIQAAGGTSGNASLSGLRLHIPEVGGEQNPQKIDINRAEVWLLETLPGIGDTLAQRIVDYRQQNGPFHNIGDIVKVAGIGTGKYEQVKDLITVAD